MIHHRGDTVTVHHGDCIEVLATLPDNSIDAVVTDPPYGLEFMGKEWDKFDRKGPASFENLGQTLGGYGPGTTRGRSPLADKPRWSTMGPSAMTAFQAWCQLWAAECLRVLRPGGHMLAFGGTRTWHRLATAIEDAGFEIRDSIAWLYGSGFPKSLDVSKAIDKAAGAEREIVGTRMGARNGNGRNVDYGAFGTAATGAFDVTTAATEAAQQWQGWGTALKPAHEPIVVARKPLVGTVAGNVLEYGTGALNVDACRIGTNPGYRYNNARNGTTFHGEQGQRTARSVEKAGVEFTESASGRWPANVALDEHQAAVLDQQSGTTITKAHKRNAPKAARTTYGVFAGEDDERAGHTDSGGAARFFYVAKAPRSERPNVDGVSHPTCKPLTLMRWLVRLVTPPGGTVLEPFAGSGTTIEAAVLEGFRCIAVEREAEYLPLIMARLARIPEPADPELTLFDGEAS